MGSVEGPFEGPGGGGLEGGQWVEFGLGKEKVLGKIREVNRIQK